MNDGKQDDVHSEAVDALVVQGNIYPSSLQYNAKFLTDEELDRYCENHNVLVCIIVLSDDIEVYGVAVAQVVWYSYDYTYGFITSKWQSQYRQQVPLDA